MTKSNAEIRALATSAENYCGRDYSDRERTERRLAIWTQMNKGLDEVLLCDRESSKKPRPHDMATETFWRWLEASQKNEIVGIEPVFMPQFIANLFDDYRYTIGEAILREAESNPERKALLEYAASVSCGSPFHWGDYVKKTEEADDLLF